MQIRSGLSSHRLTIVSHSDRFHSSLQSSQSQKEVYVAKGQQRGNREAKKPKKEKIKVVAAAPSRKKPVTEPAAIRVAVKIARPADAAEPRITAISPSRASPVSSFVSPRVPEPTFRTSAAATPSGYGKSELVTSARRSGIVNSTPSTPPLKQITAVEFFESGDCLADGRLTHSQRSACFCKAACFDHL